MATKTVHYRRFEATAGAWPSSNFQNLVTRGLAAGRDGETYNSSFSMRTFTHPVDADFSWLIHNIVQSDHNIFGTLCLFSPDIWAAVLKRANLPIDDKTLAQTLLALEIAERPPADGEDFLRGIAYWLICGNHFFVLQHVSLQTKAFELYFQQLFSAAGLSPSGERFGLTSVFDRDTVGGDLGEVTAVQIGGVVPRAPSVVLPIAASTQPVSEGVIEEQHGLLAERVTAFDKAFDVLVTIFGHPGADKIMEAVPAEAELEVDVRFGYKTKRRRVSRAALKELAEAARNLPDGEVRAIGRDGRQIGNDLRLSMAMPFKPVRERSSLLELDNAREQMLRVYQRFVQDAKIEP